MIKINSFGGCGSKYLTKQVLKGLEGYKASDVHVHQRDPKLIIKNNTCKVLFVFCDPVDAVKSFFLRRLVNTSQHGFNQKAGIGDPAWAQRHCRNIGGRHEALSINWGLKEYIAAGDELFELDEFFFSWYERCFDDNVMFIRYESIYQRQNEICDFLGLSDSVTFDRFNKRTVHDFRLSNTEARKLENMFPRLNSIVRSMNDYLVK